MNPALTSARCDSCGGTGEMGTEFGPMDCIDCGGSGKVPDRNVLADWRIRDIERAMSGGVRVAMADLQWLIRELRTARTALTEVVALAHDVDDQGLGLRIRRSAQYALGVRTRLDPTSPPRNSSQPPSAATPDNVPPKAQ